MKRIEKPAAGECASYTIMYIGLLPDDGFVLRHLADNLKTTQGFIRSFPAEKLVYMPMENGQSRRRWSTSLMTSEFTPTGRCVLRGTIRPSCPALNKTTMKFIQGQTSAKSKTF